MDGVHHVEVEKKLLAEIAELKQLEDMNSDIAATEAAELEHVDPEQVAENEQAASQAETDGAVSKKKAALREAAAAEEQQKIAVKVLEHQAEVKAESHVKKKTLEAQVAWRRPRSRSPSVSRRHFLRISTIRAQMPRRRKTSVTLSGRPRFRQLRRPLRFSRRIRQMP